MGEMLDLFVWDLDSGWTDRSVWETGKHRPVGGI